MCRIIQGLLNYTWCGGHLGVLYEPAALEGKAETNATLKSWDTKRNELRV